MAFQSSADSFGIRCFGLNCSWWHPRQANDAVASEPSIFSENHDYKVFFRVDVNTYVHISIHVRIYIFYAPVYIRMFTLVFIQF